jgi:hypothetical protein
MNARNLFISLVLLVGLLVLASPAIFAQVYVATGGDDAFGTGTALNPYRSITKGIAVATTGQTIYVEAGTYNSAVIPTELNPITLNANKNLTFVGNAVGLATTVTLTNGFVLNQASAVVNFGASGTATFTFGDVTTPGARTLTLTAGTMNITVPANVILVEQGLLTITDGTLNGIPTKGTNLSVLFNGANAVTSTSAFLPSTLGPLGTLTVNKATGDITIDNIALSVGSLVKQNAANVTIPGNLTVSVDGDITHSGTGTLTIGTSSANILTMSSTAGAGQIIVNGGGTVVVNAAITENIANAGTALSVGDGASLTPGNVFAVSVASNLTVNGNLTFNNTNVASSDGKNAVLHTVVLSNSGTGTLAINGNITTPLSAVVFSAPTGGNDNAFVFVQISNTSTGAFSVRNTALRGVAATPGVTNNAGGIMTLGQAGDIFTTDYDVVQSNAASRLVVNAASTFGGAFNNNTALGLVTFNTGATIKGILTNAGKIVLGANTLTLSGTGAGVLANTGDIYSVTTATTGSGLLLFTGASPTITGAGNLPNVEFNCATSPAITTGATIFGNLNVTKATTVALLINGASSVKGDVNMTLGNITLGANLTIEGTFNIPQGTFSFGANTLNLKGNFNRTGGIIDIAAAGTGTLNFNGASPQSFIPGVQMNVFNVTVNNTGTYLANVIANDIVTINGSLLVLRDFAINIGQVALGTSNIRMEQANSGVPVKSARFTNGGRGYTATGIGGLIFEGDGSITAAVGDGAVLAGTKPYSNIYIRLSVPANNVFCLGNVSISGTITFDGGGLTWNQLTATYGDAFTNSSLTLDNTLVTPTVVINTVNTHESPFFVDGGAGGAIPLAFNLAGTVYNLIYTGAVSGTMSASDFVSGRVNNFSIQAGTAAKIVQIFAGNATITGSLNVDNGETLNLINGVARTLTASGNGITHTVNGTIAGAGTTFEITGTGDTLTGGVGTGNASAIAGTLLVDPATGGTFTSTGMKLFGALTINQTALTSTITMNSATATVTAFTNTAGTTTLNMNSTAVSALGTYAVAAGNVTLTMNGAAPGTSTIGTNLSVTGGTLTLGSAITVTADVTHNTGLIVLGNNNLTIVGNYSNNAGTFTAGTGAVVAAPTAAAKTYTFATTTVTIPNFTVNASAAGNTITLATSGFTVSNKFTMTKGTLALVTFQLTITGNVISWSATAIGNAFITATAATGEISLQGTAPVFTATTDPTIPYLEVNTAGTASFMTSDVTTPTPRNFTVSNGFTHTLGNITLDINDLVITGGAYTTATNAGTVTGVATGANIGEVVFSGGNLTLAANYSIQNVRVTVAATKTDTKVLTVGSNFTLAAAGTAFTIGNSSYLVLGAGATITRSNGVFDKVPTFGTTVNVTYNPAGALTADVEIPTGAAVLNNLTINAGGLLALKANTTVNGTLFLAGGTLGCGGKVLTIAAGATINRSGGAFSVVAPTTDIPTVTSYQLVYSGGGAAITTDVEFVANTTAVANLTVSMTANGVVLSADRTVAAFTMSPTGAGAAGVYFALGTDVATHTLTVTGSTTINNGIVSTKDATAAPTTAVGSLVAQGPVTVNGGNLGNLGTDDGAGVDGGLNLSLNGTIRQTITLPGNTTISNLTLNSTKPMILVGGNLKVSGTVTFTLGILQTGDNILYLSAPTTGAVAGGAQSQGFINASATSHVVGNVAKLFVNNGTITGSTEATSIFPVGNGVVYRPAALTFNAAFGVPTTPNATVVVSHVDSNPGGSQNLPIPDGVAPGIAVSRYPSFYWSIYTIGTVSQSTVFDLGLTAGNFTDYDSPANVRIIRRWGTVSNTNNDWLLQGVNTGYDNQVNAVTGFTAINKNSVGGLGTTPGAVFTYGMKTNIVAATFADVIINKVGGVYVPNPYKLALAGKFTNGVGIYTYTASSTNLAIATVAVVSDTLKVTPISDGNVIITVRATDINNDFVTVSFNVNPRSTSVGPSVELPKVFSLNQNYPNPFNPTTNIMFGVPQNSSVKIAIYDMLGREVATLVDANYTAGYYTVPFNASKLASGMYIYRMSSQSLSGDQKMFSSTKKLMLVK